MSFVCAAKHATRRGFIMTDDATKCKTTGRGRPAVPPSGTRHDARHPVLASLTHHIHACVCVQAPVPSHATLQNTRPRTNTYMAVRHSFALDYLLSYFGLGKVAGAEGRAQGGLGVDWTRREGAAWREGSALVQRRAIHRWPEQFPSLLSSLRADAVQECLLLLLLLLCPR